MLLKPPGHFMIKYWRKTLLHKSLWYESWQGLLAQALGYFMALQLTHHSAEFTLVSHGVSTGPCSVSLAVKQLSNEHQPPVRTGACRNTQESPYHCMQPAIVLPMQFVAVLNYIKTHQQWLFKKLNPFILAAVSSLQSSVSVAVTVRTGFVQNETPTALS